MAPYQPISFSLGQGAAEVKCLYTKSSENWVTFIELSRDGNQLVMESASIGEY